MVSVKFTAEQQELETPHAGVQKIVNQSGGPKVFTKPLTAVRGAEKCVVPVDLDSHCDPDGQNVEAISQTNSLSSSTEIQNYNTRQNMIKQKIPHL